MNVPKPPSKPLLFTLIGLVLVGFPLTLFALQHQQILQENAWYTQQSAVSQCSSDSGTAVILATFANTESSTNQDMNVIVEDLQSGTSVDMGTVKHQDAKTVTINTGKTSLVSGSILFHLSWTNGAIGTDQFYASYKAVATCPAPPSVNFCTDNEQSNMGTCQWTPLDNAKGYTVVVKETDTGQIVSSVSVDQNATESTFQMIPGKPYICTVTPTNECGQGEVSQSPEKTCAGPTPTPSPTPPACINGNSTQGVCTWDNLSSAVSYNIAVKDLTTGKTIASDTVQAPNNQFPFNDNGIDTYECDVSATNVCGNSPPVQSPPSTCTSITPTPQISVSPTPTTPPTSTPTPTPTQIPTPTPTAIPTATPKPLPTPTPVVIVTVLTSPPQQIVITSPPQQTIIRVPGQTQTIVQQGPPQTIAQQIQPTPRPFTPVTPVPTVLPTGDTTPTVILVGTSAFLLVAGGIIFFLL